MVIKICGMRTSEAIQAAQREGKGADWIGFIFHPESPRAITADEAAALVSPDLKRVGVFVGQDIQNMAAVARKARLDGIQLHGNQSPEQLQALRSEVQSVFLIRVFWPDRYARREVLEQELERYAPVADFFLLDAGINGGGSGRTLAWETLRRLHSPRPWLLAGGLTPGNVREAVHCLEEENSGLAGVDMNSGLEDRTGHKDCLKIEAALQALRG